MKDNDGGKDKNMNKFEEFVRFMRTETNTRMFIKAPEDKEILAMCLKYGFGAVIDSAARQWQQRDDIGAFFYRCPKCQDPVASEQNHIVDANKKVANKEKI
jgi:hypothetical protein